MLRGCLGHYTPFLPFHRCVKTNTKWFRLIAFKIGCTSTQNGQVYGRSGPPGDQIGGGTSQREMMMMMLMGGGGFGGYDDSDDYDSDGSGW